jgi:2-succinyl-5-enolpyruvyl-6-hydroxy-3-cyclohexene-1-carboxylate synthase
MTDQGDVNYHWARQLLGAFASAGVDRVVISPGSRSTPLALAALREPGMRVDVIVDERSAAFFALGLAKASGVPALLIATSGSAVANWLPAVVEADMSCVPMLLLSADRPPELHGCGANQAMDQLALFGSHVRSFHQLPLAEGDGSWLGGLAGRAFRSSSTPLPGPVHINAPLREPLVPAHPDAAAARPRVPRKLESETLVSGAGLDAIRRIVSKPRGAIVCGTNDLGAGFHKAVAALAQQRGIPVFADLLSGTRFDPAVCENILAYPDQVARTAPIPDWILRFAGTPVSRAIADWLSRSREVPQIVVSATERIADPTGTGSHVLTADAAGLCEALAKDASCSEPWLAQFLVRDEAASAAAERVCGNDDVFEGSVMRSLATAMPQGTTLFIGNSLALRNADWFIGRSRKGLRILGNRGVSGIDGNISTASGIAASLGFLVAVVGDLTLFHDLNALDLARRHNVTVVVLDNGGGGIFGHLAEATLPEFEQAWLAPQPLDYPAIARGLGLEACRAETVAATVDAVLAGLARKRPRLIHVPVDRRAGLARCREFFAASAGSLSS